VNDGKNDTKVSGEPMDSVQQPISKRIRKRLSVRFNIMIVLTVLLASSTAYFSVQRYLPYISPADVCFSRNGVALGDRETCRQAMTRPLQEISMQLGYVARTPWTWAKLFRELADRCHQACQHETECSFYILQTYQKKNVQYISRPAQISGACLIHD
jgi:hypothetical protein